MGDYLLMKKILTPLLFSSLVLSANNVDLSWVDEQVQAIKPPRDGESIRNISRVKNPFIFLKKNSTKKDDNKNNKTPETKLSSTKKLDTESESKATTVFSKNSFLLGGIINKTALINGEWYNVGDTVNGYKIVKIEKKTVSLSDGSKSKLLTTATKNTKLKFKNR
jgi:hypothetical protein